MSSDYTVCCRVNTLSLKAMKKNLALNNCTLKSSSLKLLLVVLLMVYLLHAPIFILILHYLKLCRVGVF